MSGNYSLILDLLQQHVVKYFGYQDVNALRTALHRFPDEPAIKEAFYGKSLLKSLQRLLMAKIFKSDERVRQ
jgi:hypothetical protein